MKTKLLYGYDMARKERELIILKEKLDEIKSDVEAIEIEQRELLDNMNFERIALQKSLNNASSVEAIEICSALDSLDKDMRRVMSDSRLIRLKKEYRDYNTKYKKLKLELENSKEGAWISLIITIICFVLAMYLMSRV